MKKLIINTIIFSVILSSVVFVLPHHEVSAQSAMSLASLGASGAAVMASSLTGNVGVNLLAQVFNFNNLPDLINSTVATLANWAMALSGFILTTAAYILDVSIGLTLHIKAFVEATPAIYSTWRILRDITGLFFIFYLLYAAIQMMTGLGKTSYAGTVKNIVIAGILINFSFFIVSVSIDFSNVISQAIYNAMIPEEVVMRINPETKLSEVVGNAGKSNISNIFMNSLRIQQIYDTNGNRLGANISDPIKTALIGFAGVVMMLTTAASFVIAALAFISRLIILIFLLTFSSLWFVGWIIPEINKHFSFFQSQLFNQLVFMPAYLLLMYVGLTIVNGSNLLGRGSVNISAVSTAENWIMPFVLIAVNFAIVIIILNLPLVTALSMGGWATGWLSKSIGKWDARSVWKNIGLWTKDKAPGMAWNNTGGRVASKLAQSDGLKNLAGRNAFGELALKGIKGAATGYDKKLDSQIKARTDFANSLGYDEEAILKIKRDAKNLIDSEISAEQYERSRGNIVAADMHKANIASLKRQTAVAISNKQNERKGAYANRINSKIRNPESLFTRVARRDKVAAAKINIDIWQKQLDNKKEDMKDLKRKLEIITRDIRNEQVRTGGALPATHPHIREKNDLEAKISILNDNPSTDITMMGINDLQNKIDEAKLIR